MGNDRQKCKRQEIKKNLKNKRKEDRHDLTKTVILKNRN